MKTKLCKDCFYSRGYDLEYLTCAYPAHIDRTTGESVPTSYGVKFCSIIRTIGWLESIFFGSCNKHGRFFKPRFLIVSYKDIASESPQPEQKVVDLNQTRVDLNKRISHER